MAERKQSELPAIEIYTDVSKVADTVFVNTYVSYSMTLY